MPSSAPPPPAGDHWSTWQRPEVRFPWEGVAPHDHPFTSTREAREYNESMCRCCGLRMLHLWLNSRDWVRRRTEAVTFIDDRTVRRHVTVDFIMPEYAPSLSMAGRTLDVLPMALLQKKSLVSFDLRDHAGGALSLLGIRQQQTMTAAALLGVAASIGGRSPDSDLDPEVEQLVEHLVFGNRQEVAVAMWELYHLGEFEDLRNDPLFLLTCERLLDSWVMCVLLQREAVTRRILKFGYDEPLDLRYRRGSTGFQTHPESGGPTAYSLAESRGSMLGSRVLSGTGIEPVRIRFPIFSAESAQSFHLEVTAPPGAMVRAGQALASRPPGGEGRPAHDRVLGMHPTVDLHLTDAPSGGFAHAQVELRAQLSGWLMSMTIACWVNTLMLALLTLIRWGSADSRSEAGGSDIAVTLLVAFIGFGSTVVARQDAHPMLGRLLSPAKALASVSTLAALVGAGMVAFGSRWDHLLLAPTLVSLISGLVLTTAAVRSRSPSPDAGPGGAERPAGSPWDFTGLEPSRLQTADDPRDDPGDDPSDDRPPMDDAQARRLLGFDQPAIAVSTAESERHRSRWSPAVELHLRERLEDALVALDSEP